MNVLFSYFIKYVYKTFNKIYKSKYSTGSKSLKYKPNKYFNKIFNLLKYLEVYLNNEVFIEASTCTIESLPSEADLAGEFH